MGRKSAQNMLASVQGEVQEILRGRNGGNRLRDEIHADLAQILLILPGARLSFAAQSAGNVPIALPHSIATQKQIDLLSPHGAFFVLTNVVGLCLLGPPPVAYC